MLVVTTFDVDDYVRRALRGGASGFVLKDSRPRGPGPRGPHGARGGVAARAVGDRRAWCATGWTPEPAAARPGRRRPRASPRREHDVLVLVARGLSNAEIAAEMVVAESTVKTHVAHLLRKLGRRDRVQLVVHAFEHGLVPARPAATGAVTSATGGRSLPELRPVDAVVVGVLLVMVAIAALALGAQPGAGPGRRRLSSAGRCRPCRCCGAGSARSRALVVCAAASSAAGRWSWARRCRCGRGRSWSSRVVRRSRPRPGARGASWRPTGSRPCARGRRRCSRTTPWTTALAVARRARGVAVPVLARRRGPRVVVAPASRSGSARRPPAPRRARPARRRPSPRSASGSPATCAASSPVRVERVVARHPGARGAVPADARDLRRRPRRRTRAADRRRGARGPRRDAPGSGPAARGAGRARRRRRSADARRRAGRTLVAPEPRRPRARRARSRRVVALLAVLAGAAAPHLAPGVAADSLGAARRRPGPALGAACRSRCRCWRWPGGAGPRCRRCVVATAGIGRCVGARHHAPGRPRRAWGILVYGAGLGAGAGAVGGHGRPAARPRSSRRR